MEPKGKPILVVDDDPALLRLLTLRLSSAGYEVTTAESGEQALALLAPTRPQLVITDLRMENMDGMALFDAIRRANMTIPVIMLTAHGSIPEAVAATKRGVFSFLTKPFSGKELLEELERALRLSGSPASEPGADAQWRSAIVSRSAVMEELLGKAWLAAQSEATVLIRGESGTGKEVLARAIHAASARRERAFVAVNCGAIPEALLESELFGHSRGSFTGAHQNYEGLFLAAEGGSLLLDEIGDMPLSLQVKLLRVLQEREVRPVGSTKSVEVDVRIMSASHCDLEEEIEEGNFREDLFYRLNVICLEIPRLAERREDIPLLASHFLQQVSRRNKREVSGFSPEALEMLLTSAWPGNVRQLFNVVEQAVALTTTPIISEALVASALKRNEEEVLAFDQARRHFEQEYLVRLLQMTNGSVAKAARFAQRNRTDFYKLLRRNQIDPGLFKAH